MGVNFKNAIYMAILRRSHATMNNNLSFKLLHNALNYYVAPIAVSTYYTTPPILGSIYCIMPSTAMSINFSFEILHSALNEGNFNSGQNTSYFRYLYIYAIAMWCKLKQIRDNGCETLRLPYLIIEKERTVLSHLNTWASSQYEYGLSRYGWDRLIFITGIVILVRRHLYIDMPQPTPQSTSYCLIHSQQWSYGGAYDLHQNTKLA